MAPPASPPLAGLRLLIVDDVEINRSLLADLLSAEGAAVDTAEHGQAAIDLITRRGSEYFDVVLMDVHMPVLDGFQTTAILRERFPDLLIIGQTGTMHEHDMHHADTAGMAEILRKPIRVETLIERLARYTPR